MVLLFTYSNVTYLTSANSSLNLLLSSTPPVATVLRLMHRSVSLALRRPAGDKRTERLTLKIRTYRHLERNKFLFRTTSYMNSGKY
jgi:hypothetical protein